MKFILPFTLLSGIAIAFNSQACIKHPSIAQALRGICGMENLVVPSNAAMKGATSSDDDAFLQIVGKQEQKTQHENEE
ncbi:uncharacterized protein RCC_03501 [Ramularia collo-cygni]|uniref:Uncharacterized protein n=1 Tax=Ramularia collo-cygni TaxID=112498 RepID=A0A2D3V581_9PEZI|nr:uncharacterized protein RCC_03501 [Ramularia collo-cygni]CZT17664.1 uncharacterized protein RCC_03501 [Ramularia collo-cygni]